MFFTLYAGGTLFLTNDDRSRLLENFAKWNINWLFLPPSATELIPGPDAIPSIQTLVMGGEAPSRDHYGKFCNGSLTLINSYGPAENTIFTSMQVIKSKDTDPRQIGKSPNTHTWIVHNDDVTKLLPIGATGELLVEGPQVSDGYVNRPLETEQAFIITPQWKMQFEQPRDCYSQERKLYRTGDLVHYLADGSLRIDGRIGSQAKLRDRGWSLKKLNIACDSPVMLKRLLRRSSMRQINASFLQRSYRAGMRSATRRKAPCYL